MSTIVVVGVTIAIPFQLFYPVICCGRCRILVPHQSFRPNLDVVHLNSRFAHFLGELSRAPLYETVKRFQATLCPGLHTIHAMVSIPKLSPSRVPDGRVSGEHESWASCEMARICDLGVRISQMDRRSFITHQVVFVQPVLSSRALSAMNGEVSW